MKISESMPFAHPWPEALLKTIADVFVGGTPSTLVPSFWGGDIKWMSSGDVHLKQIYDVPGRITKEGLRRSNAKMVDPPAIAIALAGQGKTRGTAGMTRVPICTNQSVALVKNRNDEVDLEYLFHNLELRYEELRARSAGGGRAGLSKSIIEAIPVPLPAFKEQRKIATILNVVDDTIRMTDRLIAKLRRVNQGFRQDLLTRGIDEKGNIRSEKTHKFKDSALGRIPDKWDVISLDSIAVHVGSGVTPTGGSEVYKKEGVIFIRSQNVTFDGLLLDDVAYLDEAMHLSMKRSEVFAHDVLLNITGASIGRCCPVPEGLGQANVNQHVCAIRLPDASREDAVFLSTILASHIGQSQIDRLNAGGNREGLNYEQLRAFLIPWPSHEERARSAAILEIKNARIRTEETYREKFNSIKRGLMENLLTGKVRTNPSA